MAFRASLLALALALPVLGSPLASADGGLVHLPMTRREVVRNQLTRRADAPDGKTDAETVPLINWMRSTSYSVEMKIGTPPQSFDILVDTGSRNLWVYSTACNTTDSCDSRGNKFHAAQSSTFNETGNPMVAKYARGSASGKLVTDVVTVGTSTVRDMLFAVVDETSHVNFTETTLSGILGLSQPLPLKYTTFTGKIEYGGDVFWNRLVSQWKDPQFGIFLGRDNTTLNRAKAQPIPGGGQLTLGGVDRDLFQGDINYIPVRGTMYDGYIPPSSISNTTNTSAAPPVSSAYHLWVIPMDGMTVNGKDVSPGPVTVNRAAMIDSGTTLILGPAFGVRDFYAGIEGATLINERWLAPCDELKKSRVSFNFGSKKYPMQGSDLIAQQKTKQMCMGQVQAIFTEDGMLSTWTLGAAFLTNVYTAFRIEPRAVGFAQLADNVNWIYTNETVGVKKNATTRSNGSTTAGKNDENKGSSSASSSTAHLVAAALAAVGVLIAAL